MTIERPMFPPVADECRVIQFSSFAAAAKLAKADRRPAVSDYHEQRIAKRADKLLEVTTHPEKFSETCKNSRLRLSRRDAWWEAGHLTDYCRARLDWHSALSIAQTRGIADAHYPKCDSDNDRGALVDFWRDAVLKQMLTPAPDQNGVNWKLARLRRRYRNFNFPHDVKPERLQRAIDADVEWLKAHPSRKSVAATRQARKGE